MLRFIQLAVVAHMPETMKSDGNSLHLGTKYNLMRTTKLKSNIHQIVDRIQSEQLLETIYDFLKTRETTEPGEIWKSLTDEQKNEVLLSFEESEDEKNLVDIDEVIKRNK